MKASEVAEVLNISKGQVYRLAAAGKIPSFHIRSCVRFDPTDVAKLLETA